MTNHILTFFLFEYKKKLSGFTINNFSFAFRSDLTLVTFTTDSDPPEKETHTKTHRAVQP